MIRSKPKNGVDQFELYMSIQIIAPGMCLVLGVLYMPALAETSDFVGMLLAKAIVLELKSAQ